MAKKRRKKNNWPEGVSSKQLFPTYFMKSQGVWFYLFHSLLLLLLFYPYLETTTEEKSPWLLMLLYSVVILVIIYSISFNRRQFFVAVLLGGPPLVLYWLPDIPHAQILTLVFMIFLYLYCVFMMIPYLLYPNEVDADEIYGAASLYILLGLMWANIFQIVHIFNPHSFYVGDAHNVDQVLNWCDFIFFSFTTLTTLGYGNIAPITSQARSLAIIEALTGVIVIAIIVTRVIGLYVAQTLQSGRKGSK